MVTGKTFFSYSRDDSEFVLKLAKDLRAAGADVWLDQLDIGAGKRWDAEIETALESSQGQLVILSPSSVESNNVMDEVSYALEKGKHVIPIVFKECQIPFRLKRLQYLDFTGNYETGFNQLLKSLNLDKKKESEKVQSIPGAVNVIKLNEEKAAIEEQKHKLEGEAERKRKEQLGQETKLKPPLDMSSLPGDSGMKKSPLKSIVAIAAIVIIIILAIIVITSMGSDENATLLAQDSLQVENEPLKNNSNEEFSETIKEEPNPEVDYTSDYYEHDNGAFQREENQWIETSLESGIGPFTFKETGRDSDYIYLYDASRDMYLSLPTVEGYCYLQVKNELGDTEWQELYYLKIPK